VDQVRAAHAAGFRAEVCEAQGILATPARQVWAAARVLRDAVRRLGWAERAARDPGEAFGRSILAAFPDRLARRRDAGTLICELRHGRTAELARESCARDAELLVAAEVREVGGRGRPLKTLLNLATAVREEWLMELFPEAWRIEDATLWDERRRQVVRRVRTTCLGVTLEDKELPEVDPEKAAELLAARLAAGNLPLHGWSRDVDEWIERVRWVAATFPERALPTYGDEDRARILRDLCAGSSRYREVKEKPCLDAARRLLRRDDGRFVEEMAPAHVQLPSGRRLRIEYQSGRSPKGRARIQDLYGLAQTPCVAAGRIPLLVEILAPNLRTIQITDDLAGFWRDGYPRAKRELARKYPKHEWR
jgi:ATP-dependent helicase HrpB